MLTCFMAQFRKRSNAIKVLIKCTSGLLITACIMQTWQWLVWNKCICWQTYKTSLMINSDFDGTVLWLLFTTLIANNNNYSIQTWNDWCFRPRFCTCKAILGWEQPGLIGWISLWIWCRINTTSSLPKTPIISFQILLE